jgi:hypothetical protein
VDKHGKQNNRGTVRHGDLYSVRPEVIKEFSSVLSTVALRVVEATKREVSNLNTGLGPENDCTGQDQ